MPTITLGFRLRDGDRISPDSLHRLVEEATVTDFLPADFNLGSIQFLTYGNSRPDCVRGAITYDTTAGLEGLYYAFVTASNASISAWLCATPRRECYCWANAAVSAGSPVFIGRPDMTSAEYVAYDGVLLPIICQYTGASGPDAAFLITMESAAINQPVKCMWAGVVPNQLDTISGSASGASAGFPLFVDYAAPGAFKFGAPTARNFVFGINTLNSRNGQGAIVWGTGGCIEDIA